MGREQSLKLNITISGGSGTGTLTPTWDVARWIRCVPVAESDSYNITIKDGSGYIMASRTGQIGTLSEHLDLSLGIMKTVEIASAAQDGTYVFILDCH